MSGLNHRQRLFIDAYLECFNATEAARRAGYAEKYLHTNASRLLQNTTIKKIISERLQASTMSADEALDRLADMARADIGDFLEFKHDTGDFRIDWQNAKGKTHLIKSVKYTAHGVSIELHDPQSAIDKILKAGGEYVSRQQNLNIDMSKLTTEQLERIAAGENPINVLSDTSASGT